MFRPNPYRMGLILPGEPPSKVSKTAEYLATCVGTGVPTLANAGQGASGVLTFILCGNLKKFWLAAMKCDDTLWLEELLGFRVEDRPFLPSRDLCDRIAWTTDSPWVGIKSCSHFFVSFSKPFRDKPNCCRSRRVRSKSYWQLVIAFVWRHKLPGRT